VIVASADYRATTPDTLTAFVQDDDIPAVLEFGAQRIAASIVQETGEAAQGLTREQALERLLMAVLGGLVAALVMLVLGLLIYLLLARRRRYRVSPPYVEDAYYRRAATSENPQVRETGEHRR
jgi:NTP pyrophosphatase (non-canonical NTP hydrolase)